MNNRKYYYIFSLALFLQSLPFIIASGAAGNDPVFGGLLINPIDGNSYLAKMYQGWSGLWKFYLPYTAEPGSGAYLYMLYIFLGHLARWTNIPIIWIYHLARLVGYAGFLVVLRRFISEVFRDEQYAWRAYALAVFGSGLGWIAILFGGFTADLWLAEAYPFLSGYSNPHFPLTLMLMLILLIFNQKEYSHKRAVCCMVASFLLCLISPFGYLIVIFVLLGDAVWEWVVTRDFILNKYITLILTVMGGMPVVVYQLIIVYIDPVLKLWNDQNITISPPLWDTLISLSPAVLLALISLTFKRQSNACRYLRLLMLWKVIALVMMYFPIGLQRRLSVGIFIPVSILAVMFLREWGRTNFKWLERLWRVILCLSIPTNMVILFTSYFGIQSKAPLYFLSRGEAQALEWIEENTPEHALIMSSPEMGNMIPAHTGRRVIYGHPYETTHASVKREELLNLFRGHNNTEEGWVYLQNNSIDYVFIGPREKDIGVPIWIKDLYMVYHFMDVSIYQTISQDER